MGARAIVFLVAALSVGCATIRDREQVVYVGGPEGEVFQNGRAVGESPGYAKIWRGRRVSLEIKSSSTQPSHFVKLNSKYRWSGSLVSNFIFYGLAPVGWIVDLVSGAAWRVEDYDSKDKPAQLAAKGKTVAIAPVGGVADQVSLNLEPLLIQKIKHDPTVDILPMQQTFSIFRYHSDSPELPEDQESRYNLFFDLKADQVFVARALTDKQGMLMQSYLYDVRLQKKSEVQDWKLQSVDGLSFAQHRNWRDKFKFLPNTLFFNLTTYAPTAVIDKVEYQGRHYNDEGLLNEAFRYLSMLSMAHWERPVDGMKSHWTWGGAPALSLLQHRVRFEKYAPVADTDFRRLSANLGYGFEGGYQSPFGYFYSNLIPTLTWTQLKARSPRGSSEDSDFSLNFLVEFGYTYFLSKNFIVKVFGRSHGEDVGLWREAVQKSSGGKESVDSLSSAFVGVALGYHFPSVPPGAKSQWKVQPAKAQRLKSRLDQRQTRDYNTFISV